MLQVNMGKMNWRYLWCTYIFLNVVQVFYFKVMNFHLTVTSFNYFIDYLYLLLLSTRLLHSIETATVCKKLLLQPYSSSEIATSIHQKLLLLFFILPETAASVRQKISRFLHSARNCCFSVPETATITVLPYYFIS